MLTVFSPAITIRPYDRVLRACQQSANEQKSWGKAGVLIGPYAYRKALPEAISVSTLLMILAGMWLFLWVRRARKGVTFQTGGYSKLERVVVLLAALVSMALLSEAVALLISMMTLRHGMSVASRGSTEEYVWNVGQIGALFAWTPLLVEMAYTATSGGRSKDEGFLK
ncbi:MAG: hypothetical protein M1813_007291 [Trichoglossum hirsutum]|nr:MAG: hypothetical protein M1813_007291 [Trichoglossum hirsutum]